MIDPISLLVVGTIGGMIGAAIATYWEEIRDWMKKAYDVLAPIVKKTCKGIVSAIKWTGRAMVNGLMNLVRFYSYLKETKKWTETTVTKIVNESKVPEHIRNKLKLQEEVDTTEEMAEVLDLKLV